MSAMRFDKLLVLRNVARGLGVSRVISSRSKARFEACVREYAVYRPTKVKVSVAGHAAQFIVTNGFEYARARSWKDEARLLAPVLASVRKGDSCWDIGASVGLYTMLLSSAVGASGKVVSFEPEPRSNQRLRQNILTNAVHNVCIFDFALGSERGQVMLEVSDNLSSGTHSIVLPEYLSKNGTHAMIEVEVFQGDQVLSDQDLPIPRLIKIDVEGAEELVIQGLRRILSDSRCRSVFCEIHFSVLHSRGDSSAVSRIMEALSRYGFRRLSWLDKSHLFALKEDT